MDNLTNDANPTNLELLRIARDLAYNDYDNRRTDIHNKWVYESAQLWQTAKQRLAYPSMPSYPSEDEIIDRAIKLISFLDTIRPDLENKEAVITPSNETVTPYSEEHMTEESSEKMLSSMMKKFENLFNKGDRK